MQLDQETCRHSFACVEPLWCFAISLVTSWVSAACRPARCLAVGCPLQVDRRVEWFEVSGGAQALELVAVDGQLPKRMWLLDSLPTSYQRGGMMCRPSALCLVAEVEVDECFGLQAAVHLVLTK
jgi:hypothetical protein